MTKCPSCSSEIVGNLEACPSCGSILSISESLNLTKNNKGKKDKRKKGKSEEEPLSSVPIIYEENYVGSPLKAVWDVLTRPADSKSIFFSRNRPSMWIPLVYVVFVMTTHVLFLYSKTNRVFVNGEAPSNFELVSLSLFVFLAQLFLQLIASSIVFGFVFKLSFRPESLGSRKPIETFLRLNIYRLTLHAIFSIFRIILLFQTPPSVQEIDLLSGERYFTTPFPSWFLTADLILINIPYILSAIVIYRVMSLTFEMGTFNSAVAASFSLIPVIFSIV